jgi:hypothetical protein
MTAFVRIFLVALLAYAQLVSAYGEPNCNEDPNAVLGGVTYEPTFPPAEHDKTLSFKVVSSDGTSVTTTKKIYSNNATNVVKIYNEKLGGPTSIALKYNHYENGQAVSSYVRFFQVGNGVKCVVDKSKEPPQGEELVFEASYYTLKK